jgi:hypothetical protein
MPIADWDREINAFKKKKKMEKREIVKETI